MMVFDTCEEGFEKEGDLQICAAFYCGLGGVPRLAFFPINCVYCVL